MTPERRAELLNHTMLGRSVALPAAALSSRFIYYNCEVMSEDDARALMAAEGVTPEVADMVVMAAEEWTYSPGPRGGKRWIHNTTGKMVRSEPTEEKEKASATEQAEKTAAAVPKMFMAGSSPADRLKAARELEAGRGPQIEEAAAKPGARLIEGEYKGGRRFTSDPKPGYPAQIGLLNKGLETDYFSHLVNGGEKMKRPGAEAASRRQEIKDKEAADLATKAAARVPGTPVPEDFVRKLFDLRHSKDLASERFKAIPESQQKTLVGSAMAKARVELNSLAKRIDDKDTSLVTTAWLHPSNKIYRELFTHLTGQELPSTATGTAHAIKIFVGQDKLNALQAQKDAEQAVIAKAKQDKENARVQVVKDKIERGEKVSGTDLVDAARSVGHDIHPRTVRMLRDRVHEINHEQGAIRGKDTGNSPFDTYKAVRAKIQKATARAEKVLGDSVAAIPMPPGTGVPNQKAASKSVAREYLVQPTVEVTNLSSGNKSTYGPLSARDAAIAAHAHSRGDHNTWDYEKKYGHLVRIGQHSVGVGDHVALLPPVTAEAK